MSTDGLEELIDEPNEKLRQLYGATIFIKSKHNIRDELQKMNNEVLQISYGIEIMRKDLEKMKEQNVQCRELLSSIKTLDKRIIHEENNVPSELIRSYRNVNKQTHIQAALTPNEFNCTISSTYKLTEQKTPGTGHRSNIEKPEVIRDCKRTLFNEPDTCPTIPFITMEEFSKVPKYIIGRQSLETINNLISAINQTLITKYTLLSLGKTAAQRKGEINLYLYYRRQECDIQQENGYVYFFTAEDYHRQTKTKLDKTKLNLITALRHCKRLRECRIKNELRYVITPH